jgi:hypothetical protein
LRFRDFRLEDWLLVVLGLAVIVFFTWILSGCVGSEQRAATATYSDGCYFHIAGVDSKTAESMHDQWDFNKCHIDEKSDVNSEPDLPKE